MFLSSEEIGDELLDLGIRVLTPDKHDIVNIFFYRKFGVSENLFDRGKQYFKKFMQSSENVARLMLMLKSSLSVGRLQS